MAKKLIYLPIGILTSATAISAGILSAGGVGAAAPTVTCSTVDGVYTCKNTTSVTASVTVADACTLALKTAAGEDYSGLYTGAFSLNSGTSGTTEGASETNPKPNLVATCNDPDGFTINAVGASDKVTVSGTDYTNYMVGDAGNIATGTSGDNSYWAFKVTSATGTGATITTATGYNNWSAIPNASTPIVTASSVTGGTATATVRTDYKVYVSSAQPAGTYTGRVAYSLVQPE